MVYYGIAVLSNSDKLLSMQTIIQQQGFGLLDVLVAWLIASVIALGLQDSLRESLRQSQQAYWRSVAMHMANNLLQRLYSVSPSARQSAYQQWQPHITQWLPQGAGTYHCSAIACQVNVTWQFHGEQHYALP